MRSLKILLMTLLVLFHTLWPACALPPQVSEYQIKAAFLYNFAKFVEWPICDAGTPKRLFVIGILGDDPFGPEISAIEKKRIKNKTLMIVRSQTLDEMKSCDVIFISASVRPRLAPVLEQLQGWPVLTVGDTRGFAQAGVMINLFTQDNKVRFEINPTAVEQAKLKISSKLLKLARIVAPETN